MNPREAKATVLLTGLFLFSAALTNAQVKSKSHAGGGDLIGRGKYRRTGRLCVECHTPRDKNGHLQRTEYLRARLISVKSPPYPQMKWALKAPAIAGLPGYTEEQSIRLLTEGLTRDGKRPDPPMPQFRLESL